MNSLLEVKDWLNSTHKIKGHDKSGQKFELNSAEEIQKEWGVEFQDMRSFQAGVIKCPNFIFRNNKGKI